MNIAWKIDAKRVVYMHYQCDHNDDDVLDDMGRNFKDLIQHRNFTARYNVNKEGTVGTREAPRIWSKEEDEILLNAVEKYGEFNWHGIAIEVPSRNRVQCRERYEKVLKPGLKRGEWTTQEDALLKNAVEEYGEKDWKFIATKVPNRNNVKCRDRYNKVLKPGLKRGRWTTQEDDLLKQLYKNEMRRQNVGIHDETRPTHVSIAFLIHIHIYISNINIQL